VTSDDEPSTTDVLQPGPPAGRPGSLIARRARLAASRRRPWWKWLLIGLLLAFSLATTGLLTQALITDISRHHWADALDASRDAVPAAVGWAALLLLFFPRSTMAAERLLSADDHALTERLHQAARDQASMDNAEQKVQRLTAKLARLTAAREHAVAETTARLEQARQWLTSARDATTVSQRAVAEAEDRLASDFPDLTI
jgi:hypothetical protein